ncbi:hypothetical protein [Sinosporangium siamense]|uniref:hypothetical protein n=1 Tax=Sinosporangium siamense TaxID=1367973 RepID=UPI0036D38BA0
MASLMKNRNLLLAGAVTVVVAFAAGGFAVQSLGGADRDSTAVTDEQSSDGEDTGGANGADLAYQTEWSEMSTRQTFVRSPECSAINFSQAACLSNPGRSVSEPYMTVRQGHVCAADFNEATQLASANRARLTGKILSLECSH